MSFLQKLPGTSLLHVAINVNNGNTHIVTNNKYGDQNPFSPEAVGNGRKPPTISSSPVRRQIPIPENENPSLSPQESPLPLRIEFRQPDATRHDHALSIAEKDHASLQKEWNRLLSSADQERKHIKKRITKLENLITQLEKKIRSHPEDSYLRNRLALLEERLLIYKCLETQHAMIFWPDWTPEMRAEFMEGISLQPSDLDTEPKREEIHGRILELLSPEVMAEKSRSMHRIQKFLKSIDIRAEERKKLKNQLVRNQELRESFQNSLRESRIERAEGLQFEQQEANAKSSSILREARTFPPFLHDDKSYKGSWWARFFHNLFRVSSPPPRRMVGV